MNESLVEFFQGKADELITHGLFTPLVTLLGAAAITAVAARIGTLKAFREVANGGNLTNGLNISRTDYWPTGELNPATGREFFRQDIIVIDEASLSDIFNASLRDPIIKAIHEAEKMTTEDNPIVYQHLPKAAGAKYWPVMKKAIQRLSRAHFSDMFNDAAQVARDKFGPRERPTYDLVLPLLVREPSEKGMRSKFILLPIKDGKLPSLPPLSDVQFFEESSDRWEPHFVAGEGQPLANRYRLVQRISEVLNDPANAWIRNFSVRVRTGRHEHVQEPRLAAA